MALAFETGRDREIGEIVRAKRAAAVGRLLLGELDGPLEAVFAENFRDWPRARLKEQRDIVRASLRGEIASFCQKNFEGLTEARLAALYEPVFEHGSSWRVPLVEFQQRFGKPKDGVLLGAPLHATVCISPWGLQTEYPEQHLAKDLDEATHTIVECQDRINEHERLGRDWKSLKRDATRDELAKLLRRCNFNCRMALITSFNLVEAYVNGLAWEYVQVNGVGHLSDKNRNLLTEDSRPVRLVDKLVKIPRIINGASEGPLHDSRDPLRAFIDVVKPFRDAIVHASPFSATQRFGGYDKLEKLYDLNSQVALIGVAVTLDVICEIHRFLGGVGDGPQWLPLRLEQQRLSAK